VTAISFDYAWQNQDLLTAYSNVLEVSYAGVLYARLTTGGSILSPTGSWEYFNGATGTGGSVGQVNEASGSLSTNTITLPVGVTASGDLVFTYGLASGNGSDDIAIDNVAVINTATLTTSTRTIDLADNGWTASYTENGAAVAIADSDSSIFDPDSPVLSGGTVSLTNYQAGDLLRVDGSAAASGTLFGTISWVRSGANGEVITLSGAASAAQYADAIERITFENTTDSPSTVTRLVAVKVSDGNGDSNTAIATIDVTAVNDAPAGTDNTVTVNEDASRSFAAADFGFSDVDAGDTLSAVRIDTLTLPAGATLEL